MSLSRHSPPRWYSGGPRGGITGGRGTAEAVAAGSGEGLGLHVFVYDGEVETRALLEALAAQGWRRCQLPPAPPPAPSPARPPAAALAIAEGRRGSTTAVH